MCHKGFRNGDWDSEYCGVKPVGVSSPPFRIFSASAGEAQAQARHRFSEINSPRLCLASPSGASTGRRRPPAARHRNGARPRVSFHRIDQS
jgi:hypothetical protein